jgi:hypothetical protein
MLTSTSVADEVIMKHEQVFPRFGIPLPLFPAYAGKSGAKGLEDLHPYGNLCHMNGLIVP